MAPTIAITGSASGIGAAIAKLYAAKGYNLVLSDSATAVLKSTTEYIQSQFPAVQILSQPTDVSKLSELESLRDAALAKFKTVDLLVLNAGVHGNYKTEEFGWWGNPEGMRKLFDVNLYGIVNGISAFLPTLRAQAKTGATSRVVITISKQGISNPPGNPAYNASKAAIRFLGEQLSYDMKDENVKVHMLAPGWTYTGMVGGSPGIYIDSVHGAKKPEGAWSPDQVAEYMDEGIAKEHAYIICPDNETSSETDKIRFEWSAGDITTPRLPLSRWRPEYKDEYATFDAARRK
ncbi:hypothetical protein BZA70DRAFT_277468 [Myxozyma melibiosi]|uniref:Short chain dehydrogenase/reductase n=1 Tax=Myxozyma melibiosi TaxID=54550 RepID=A0ABR1FA34_9ASCO